jgi:centromeric protein E
MRIKLEEERRALAAFVSKFDSLGLGGLISSKPRPPMPTAGGASAAFAERQQNKGNSVFEGDSPVKIEMSRVRGQPNLLEQMPEDEWSMVEDMSFDEKDFKAGSKLRTKDTLGGKENMPA